MEYLGKVLFAAAAIILAIGVFTNLSQDGSIAGTGTMAMNTYYLLGMTYSRLQLRQRLFGIVGEQGTKEPRRSPRRGRLVRALEVETYENWLEAHRYLNMEDLKEHKKDQLREAA